MIQKKIIQVFLVVLTAGRCFAIGEKSLQPLFDNSDFEKGDLTNWAATGDAFEFQPTLGNNTEIRHRKDNKWVPAYGEGEYWVGTLERYNGKVGKPGDAQSPKLKGKLTSKEFVIEKPYIRFKVGGTCDKRATYTALFVDGKEVGRYGGRAKHDDISGRHWMGLRFWDVKKYVGKRAYIEIVDDSDTGHIQADSFFYVDYLPGGYMFNGIMPEVGKSMTVGIRDYVYYAMAAPNDDDGRLEFRGLEIGAQDKYKDFHFDMINLGDYKVAFRSRKTGKYISADPKGEKNIAVTADSIGIKETFLLEFDQWHTRDMRNLTSIKALCNDKYWSSYWITEEWRKEAVHDINYPYYKGGMVGVKNISDYPALNPNVFKIVRIEEELYDEIYRPQYHYSPKFGWMNDVNGMYYDAVKDEFNLCYQYCPRGVTWAGMNAHWGHATSKDMFNWTELPPALIPDKNLDKSKVENGCWSGSAVVDFNNSLGMQKGDTRTIAAFYSSVGGKGIAQNMAYSTDGGVTFKKYEKNPVVPTYHPDNRDPKVFWHEESKKWVMVFWILPGYTFFTSDNLTDWEKQGSVEGYYECPDMFKLYVDGDKSRPKWILVNGGGDYVIGQFDGKNFTPDEGSKKQSPVTGGAYYATQTFSLGGQKKEKRRIQMAWMVAVEAFANMPFSQQLSLPSELKLKTYPEAVKIARVPVKEVYGLRGKKLLSKKDFTLKPGDNPLKHIQSDLLNIVMEFEPVAPGKKGSFFIDMRGQSTRFEFYGEHNNHMQVTRDFHTDQPVERQPIFQIGAIEPIEKNGAYKVELFLDRTSLDVYVDDGRYSAPIPIWPRPGEFAAEMKVLDGAIKFKSLEVWQMHSAWK